VLVVVRLRPPVDAESFRAEMRGLIEALAARPGHVATRLAEPLEDLSTWVLVSEWLNVGSYRRALSSYDVKTASGPLMVAALDEPSAYEVLESAAAAGQ
jgi:quinol monooxygenase YgiN